MSLLSPNSFEVASLKTGLNGSEYDLSFLGLETIRKEDLLDLLNNGVYNIEGLDLGNISIEDLKDHLKSELLRLHAPEYFDIFGIKEPTLSSAQNEFYTEKNFPPSVITSLTHGTYNIPSEIRRKIKSEIHHNILSNIDSNNKLDKIRSKEVIVEVNKQYSQFLRILKNYSDFGTRYLVNKSFIPDSTVVKATSSRGITDPARVAGEVLRQNDFCNNALPNALFEGVEKGTESYDLFHRILRSLIDKTILAEGGVTLIDDHDTGATCTGGDESKDSYKPGGFPLVNLGVKGGTSCNPEIVSYYAERIEYHLGIVPTIDKPYKGGFVTTHYGAEGRNKRIEEGENPGILNVIQQEVGKFLYLDGTTQKLDQEKIKIIGNGLARAKADLGRKFGKEYYTAVNIGIDAKNKYLSEYREIE